MARDLTVKYKRGLINWCLVLLDIKDESLNRRYYAFKKSHPCMSDVRCAYYVLQKTYSTTTLSRVKQYATMHGGVFNVLWFFPPLRG